MVDRHVLSWDCGEAAIEPLGAMLGPVEFRLPSGRPVSPLAVAPWGDDTGPEHDALLPLLKRLRGEWPCVPFGAPRLPEGLPGRWGGVTVEGMGDDFHGFCSNNTWTLADKGDGWVELTIDYPDNHVVRRLVRKISGVLGQTALEMELTVEVRRDVSLPVALHPVFRLPERPGSAKLDAGRFEQGWTFPAEVEKGVSRFVPDAGFSSLSAVPSSMGEVAADCLPLDFDTEELLQLAGVQGCVTLRNEKEGYDAFLEFDPQVFNGVVLWLSNRGRTAYPWLGRFLAIGIEPVRAAFDLGPEVGCNPENPMAKVGFSTALRIKKDAHFSTTYRIGVKEA